MRLVAKIHWTDTKLINSHHYDHDNAKFKGNRPEQCQTENSHIKKTGFKQGFIAAMDNGLQLLHKG